MNYSFDGLSDFDFECLIHDTLELVLKVRLEQFARGRDGGIDLRHMKDRRSSIIVQCKHWSRSGFRKLIHHLRTSELPKIRRLRPSRYILATSLGLTPHNKREISRVLRPFIRTDGDIWGADDINAAIRRFPSVERNHFKLYLTTATQLQYTFARDTLIRSQFHLPELEARARLFVPGKGFREALEILRTHKACIVAGPPGTGKTTLASMLALHFIKQGFEFINISSDISEGDRLFGDNQQKQVFLYDDFLGQTASFEKLTKNEDGRLLAFMQRVSESTNKYFLLTTREYILQQAQMRYERVDSSSKMRVTKLVLDVKSYSRIDRAQILFNHIFFADIPPTWRRSIARAYQRIIDHAAFNPRLIEGAISLTREAARSPQEFVTRLTAVFDQPQELWLHPFERHLTEDARQVLLNLACLPPEVAMRGLERSVGKQLSSRRFKDALRQLNASFVSIDSSHTVRLLNPSIRDFLLGYLDQHLDLASALLSGAEYFEQAQYFALMLFDESTRNSRLQNWLNDNIRIIRNRLDELWTQSLEPAPDGFERAELLIALATKADDRLDPREAERTARALNWDQAEVRDIDSALNALRGAVAVGALTEEDRKRSAEGLLNALMRDATTVDDCRSLIRLLEHEEELKSRRMVDIRLLVNTVVEREVEYIRSAALDRESAQSLWGRLQYFTESHGPVLSPKTESEIENRIRRLRVTPRLKAPPVRKMTSTDDETIEQMFALLG